MESRSSDDPAGMLDPSAATGVQFNLWRSPHVDGLDMVQSTAHLRHYPLHLHEAMEIIWVREGRGVVECRGRHYPVQAGAACIVSPYETHGGGAADESAAIRFHLFHVPQRLILPGFLARFFRDPRTEDLLPIKIIARDGVERLLFDLMIALQGDRDPARHQHTIANALDGLLALESGHRRGVRDDQARHPAIEQVKALIRQHCAEPLNVESLASAVALNERYLISLFRHATGVPPHQFQIAVRIDRARRLLPSGTPLSGIAAASGFADQSHLNRHFKRQYGFTPGVFRRLLQPT